MENCVIAMEAIIFLLLFVGKVFGQESPVPIIDAITNDTIKEFQDGVLNCSIKTVPTLTSTVQWIKVDPKTPVLISTGDAMQTGKKKYTVDLVSQVDRGISTLTVHNASRADSGRYRCVLRTLNGIPFTEWPQKDGFLFIKVMPQVEGIITNVTGYEKQNAVLKCNVRDLRASESDIQWLKIDMDNPAIISVGSKYQVKLTNNGDMSTSNLTIRNLGAKDAGTYRCVIRTRGVNSNEWPQQKGYLKVQAWPTIQGVVNNQTIYEGNTGKLNCGIKDFTSKSQVKWAKVIQGTEIVLNQGDKFNLKLVKSNVGDWSLSTLTILSVTLTDAGRYRCIVQSKDIPNTEWPKQDGFITVKARDSSSQTVGNNRNGGSYLRYSNFWLQTLALLICVAKWIIYL